MRILNLFYAISKGFENCRDGGKKNKKEEKKRKCKKFMKSVSHFLLQYRVGRNFVMTNQKVYHIAVVLIFMTPLFFKAVSFVAPFFHPWIYKEEDIERVKNMLYYATPIVITMILLWRKEISKLIEIVMDSFSASNKRSTYSWPKLRFQYSKVTCLIPWNLVLVILVYINLMYYQHLFMK